MAAARKSAQKPQAAPLLAEFERRGEEIINLKERIAVTQGERDEYRTKNQTLFADVAVGIAKSEDLKKTVLDLTCKLAATESNLDSERRARGFHHDQANAWAADVIAGTAKIRELTAAHNCDRDAITNLGREIETLHKVRRDNHDGHVLRFNRLRAELTRANETIITLSHRLALLEDRDREDLLDVECGDTDAPQDPAEA